MWEFVQQYFITPIYTGEGYNIFNTVVYALLFIGSLYGVKWLLKKWRIKSNKELFWTLVPYIALAGLVRALQDLWPAKHWLFITPGIYLLFTALVISVLLLTGKDLKKTRKIGQVGFAIATMLLVLGAKLLSIAALVAILALAITATAVLWQVFPRVLASKENKTVVFSQLLDASATAVALEFYGYSEQHVVSGLLTSVSPWLFFVVKACLVIGALYMINNEKNEWNWLLKIAVMTLGLGPGTRDLARVFIGV